MKRIDTRDASLSIAIVGYAMDYTAYVFSRFAAAVGTLGLDEEAGDE